jgi:hypothetical protein
VKCVHCPSERLSLDASKRPELFAGDAQISLRCDACNEETIVRVFDDRNGRGVYVHTTRPRKGGGWKEVV